MQRKTVVFDCTGNLPKIEQRYPRDEVESVFDDTGRVEGRAYDVEGERRFATIGRATTGRLMFVAYTFRGLLIRPLSARPVRDYERAMYEEDKS